MNSSALCKFRTQCVRNHGDLLSLRPPQKESMEILARLCELLPLEKGTDTTKALAALRADFPTVEDFALAPKEESFASEETESNEP